MKTTLLLISICLIFLFTSVKTFSQTLDDFRIAADNARYNRGVGAIPFRDLREQGRAIQGEVDYNWVEKLEYSYSGIRLENMALLDAVDNSKPEDLNANTDKLKFFIRENIIYAIEVLGRLWNSRVGVREIFSEAERRLREIQRNPEGVLGNDVSNSNLKELSDYIEEIINFISGRQAEVHLKVENDTRKNQMKYIELWEINNRKINNIDRYDEGAVIR